MRARYLILAFFAIVAVSPTGAQVGQQPGDVQAGSRLAVRVCEECHVVAGQPQVPSSLTGYGPSFFAIANGPNATAQSLQTFLSRPHALSEMPYPNLTAEQRADVAAYILSLRGRR